MSRIRMAAQARLGQRLQRFFFGLPQQFFFTWSFFLDDT